MYVWHVAFVAVLFRNMFCLIHASYSGDSAKSVPVINVKQVHQQDAYGKRGGGAVTDMCNTPLIVWLYLAYSRQLKLTASLNADGILKNLDFRRVSGWSLLDGHMWSPCGLSSIAYSMWVNDRLALQTRSSEAWTATHQWILFMTQTDDDMKDKLSKNIFDPHLESGDP